MCWCPCLNLRKNSVHDYICTACGKEHKELGNKKFIPNFEYEIGLKGTDLLKKKKNELENKDSKDFIKRKFDLQ